MAAMEMTCEYCGHVGTYGVDIELRERPRTGDTIRACIDTAACDERAEALEGGSDD